MSAPVLEIAGARPAPGQGSPIAVPIRLRLDPGDLALVDAPDPGMARALAELCAGLPALAEGEVRLLGRDLARLNRREAEALRGRIGLAPGAGGWLPHLSVEENMLLARRHHGAPAGRDLLREAEALCWRFGLDGIPAAAPQEMSGLDLARAGCARALLGRPALLLLESPLDAESADALVAPLRVVLRQALERGAAALWATRSPRAWRDPDFPATQRHRLDAGGLVPA